MIRLLGVAIVAVGLTLAYLLYEIWPAVVHSTGDEPSRQNITLFHGSITFKPSTESVLILLVILAGALGAYVAVANAFVGHVGRRTFARSWYWWYVVHLPVGSGLALILYFAFRGGLLAADASSEDVNPYGIAALAALAGLFSRQAVDKLEEVWDTFFRTGEEDRDAGVPEAEAPQLTAIEPASFSSAQGQELKLAGSGFAEGATASIAPASGDAPGLLLPPKAPPTETEMIVEISPNALPAGVYAVRVVNPPPRGGVSEAQPLEVTP